MTMAVISDEFFVTVLLSIRKISKDDHALIKALCQEKNGVRDVC